MVTQRWFDGFKRPRMVAVGVGDPETRPPGAMLFCFVAYPRSKVGRCSARQS